MVWGGINVMARTELVCIDHGTLNSQRYIEEILMNHVMPFAPFIGQNFMLMQDNARPHTVRCVVQ